MKEKTQNKEKMQADETTKDQNDILEVYDSLQLKDGVHTGEITKIRRELRNDFDYTDIYFSVMDDNGNTGTIKTGFPSNLSPNTMLYKFVEESGLTLKKGQKVSLTSLSEILHGRIVQFQVYHENNFPRIINKTIKFVDIKTV